ncbi:MAG: hypothetical protein ACE15C_16395 [Phycisphaerae bacterium]
MQLSPEHWRIIKAHDQPLRDLLVAAGVDDEHLNLSADGWASIVAAMVAAPRPIPQALASPQPAVSAPVVAAEGQRRLAVCMACREFNGNLCELAFPQGCCPCTWGGFLATGSCPAGTW